MYAIKSGTIVLLDIIQIVTFAILPSVAIVLVIVGIKWLTNKMSYTQKKCVEINEREGARNV